MTAPGRCGSNGRARSKAQRDSACDRLESRAKERAASEQAQYQRKVAAREKRKGRRKGKRITPPKEEPKGSEHVNLTDADSHLMRRNTRSDYQPCYNAQAVVDAEGRQWVLSRRVSQSASDSNEWVADVQAIAGRVGTPRHVLADNGYANGEEVAALSGRGMEVLVAVGSEDRRCQHALRPVTEPKPEAELKAPWLVQMREKMALDGNRAMYRLRKPTVESVFGVIKQAMGFRQFLLRGEEKVAGEWELLSLAYNCKRLHNRMRA